MRQGRTLPTVTDRSGCPAPYHGTRSAYMNARPACRCADACEDRRLYRKRREHGLQPVALIPALGVQRRLRALNVIGHSMGDVSAASGVPKNTLQDVIAGHRPTLTAATDRAIRIVYPVLAVTPGGSSPQAIGTARAKGWHSPMQWHDIDDPHEDPSVPNDHGADGEPAVLVDDVAVAEAVAGRFRWDRLNPTEQEIVVGRVMGTRDRHGNASWLGCSETEYASIRERLRRARRAAEVESNRTAA